MADLFVPITMFGSIGVCAYAFISARHKERMAIIERGLNPAEFSELYKPQAQEGNPMANLKWGLFILLLGIGLLFSIVFTAQAGYQDGERVGISFGIMLVSGGAALILYYLIARRLATKS